MELLPRGSWRRSDVGLSRAPREKQQRCMRTWMEADGWGRVRTQNLSKVGERLAEEQHAFRLQQQKLEAQKNAFRSAMSSWAPGGGAGTFPARKVRAFSRMSIRVPCELGRRWLTSLACAGRA